MYCDGFFLSLPLTCVGVGESLCFDFLQSVPHFKKLFIIIISTRVYDIYVCVCVLCVWVGAAPQTYSHVGKPT